MISKTEAILIGLAALAGFALTMGGWHPVSSSDRGIVVLYDDELLQGLRRLATWTAAGAAALAAFFVVRRRG